MKLRQSTRHEVGIGSHPGPRTVAVTSNPDTCGTHVDQVETIVVSGIGYARAENCTGQRMNGGSRNMPSSFSRLLNWKLHRPPIEYPSAGSMLFTDGWMLLRLVSTSPRSRNSFAQNFRGDNSCIARPANAIWVLSCPSYHLRARFDFEFRLFFSAQGCLEAPSAYHRDQSMFPYERLIKHGLL